MFLSINNWKDGTETFVEVSEYEIYGVKGQKDPFKSFELSYTDITGKHRHPFLLGGTLYVTNNEGKTIKIFDPKNVVLPE